MIVSVTKIRRGNFFLLQKKFYFDEWKISFEGQVRNSLNCSARHSIEWLAKAWQGQQLNRIIQINFIVVLYRSFNWISWFVVVVRCCWLVLLFGVVIRCRCYSVLLLFGVVVIRCRCYSVLFLSVVVQSFPKKSECVSVTAFVRRIFNQSENCSPCENYWHSCPVGTKGSFYHYDYI